MHIASYLPEMDKLTFDDFYRGYPKKANEQRAEKLWGKLSAEDKAKAIIDTKDRADRHAQWRDKQFVPAPDVYLRDKKWNDEIIEARTKADEQESLEDGSNLGRFWTLLKQTYGDERIKRQYGETPPFMWKKALDGLKKKEIARIINYLMHDNDQSLPTLHKIVRIRKATTYYGPRQLPKPKADKEKALKALEEIKSRLKK